MQGLFGGGSIMRGTIVGIVLFILACSSGALADRTPSTRTSEAPFSWAGLYVGANGKYGWVGSCALAPKFLVKSER